MPKLIMKAGDRTGAEFGVTDGTAIGRQADLPIQLSDVKASREHARIVSGDPGWVLVDLGSTNGTFVNGQRMNRQTLHHGDQIRIGGTVLVYHDPPTPPPVPAQKIDLGLPPPKKLNLDVPPPAKVNVKLVPGKTRRDRHK